MTNMGECKYCEREAHLHVQYEGGARESFIRILLAISELLRPKMVTALVYTLARAACLSHLGQEH